MSSPALRLAATLCLVLTSLVRGDVPLPPNILEPSSPAEAWNIIRLVTANSERLAAEKRPEEIANQISLCSPALRLLARATGTPESQKVVDRATSWVVATASAGIEKNPVRATNTLRMLRTDLAELEKFFPPAAVNAEVFTCPTHPTVTSLDPSLACVKCGRGLFPRRIPYSFIYVPPSKPTLQFSAQADAPLEAGRKATVKVKLLKADGSPVLFQDLTVVHGEPLHVLAQERGLGDYQREFPERTETPGEYVFTFTPKKTAPYRLWADLVPLSTGLQELPFVDLPSGGTSAPPRDKDNAYVVEQDGLIFEMAVGGHVDIRERTTCGIALKVSRADGTPMNELEPLMNSFAHLIGFYDDFETVVHLHPVAGDVTNRESRGGPVMSFNFYPPRAGFVRLYCQVQVKGRKIYAPFNVNVLPQ